ncbi:hypothetical protein PSA7680_02977 [Pseudoruegeria aquimaris]|uniref:DUF2927 domain-containing protein n=1 Tax=Pseudoruegeria aquimaris TaxID=393663 RepID=A0A1Y5T9Q0_9RHOB|nr:DUF2927 domain-containing protein [Pseudoruegeria aquimaris]SLN57042.1 hypothetical protein PSA7680_02977 [Pseudoruegeria aquimaris]
MNRRRPRLRRAVCAAATCLGLLGVAGHASQPVPSVTRSSSSPSKAQPASARKSSPLQAHYARVQNDFVRAGYLRTDRGKGVRYDRLDLVNNFTAIALATEYDQSGGRLSGRGGATTLKRWEEPVRVSVEFGASVPAAQRQKDTSNLKGYTRRLAAATRHPVSLAKRGGNFHVLILNEAERKAAGPRLKQLVPTLSQASIRHLTKIPRSQLCLVVSIAPGGEGTPYRQAIAMIPAELPDLLRLSCIHEEVAQGLGLPNDSPRARPSLFNDDKEFALLTRHDETLLRILYDPRLKVGMDAKTARPIVDRILWDMKLN